MTEDFLLGVYRRGSMMATALTGGVAVPRGTSEYILRPVIAITRLDTPVAWDGTNLVNLIFVLTLDENSRKYFEQLYWIIFDESMVSVLRDYQKPTDAYRTLCESARSGK